MKTIRRLYVYAVALIGVEVVLWGVIGLLRSIFKTQDIVDGPTQLAQAFAFILVGLPIFLVHWLMAQKAAAKDKEEHSSTLRALFLYGVLFATLVATAQNLLALIDRSMLQIAHLSGGLAIAGGSQSLADNLIAIAANIAIAAYFYSILQQDRRTLGDASRFDEVRRLYRIVWVSYSLVLTIFGAQQALNYAFRLPSSVLGSIGRETALNAIALLVTGAPIWFFAWRSLQAALAQPEEQDSYLRLGFLYLLSMIGLITTMVTTGQLIYQLLLRALGEGFTWAKFLSDVGGPISIGVPMAALWAYYRRWLATQVGFDGDLARRAGKWRLSIYLRSLLGLVAVAAGLISLFSVLVPWTLGSLYAGSEGLRTPLSGSLAALFIGLLVWLLAWREAQAQMALHEGIGESARRSVIRKVFLYLVVFGSVIGAMVSAGLSIYSLVNAALGGTENDLWKTVIQNLANLLVFGVLLYYHLTILRADGSVRAEMVTTRQAAFRVRVLEAGGGLGTLVHEAFSHRQLHFTVETIDAAQPIPEAETDLVILSSELTFNAPDAARAWLQTYSGPLIVVGNASAREIWTGDCGLAADAARSIFEGNLRDARRSYAKPSVWTYVAYVCAVLFGMEFLFFILSLVISLVAGM